MSNGFDSDTEETIDNLLSGFSLPQQVQVLKLRLCAQQGKTKSLQSRIKSLQADQENTNKFYKEILEGRSEEYSKMLSLLQKMSIERNQFRDQIRELESRLNKLRYAHDCLLPKMDKQRIPSWLNLLLDRAIKLEIAFDGFPEEILFSYKIPWTTIPELVGGESCATEIGKRLELLISIYFDTSPDRSYFIGIWNIKEEVDLHSTTSISLPGNKAIASCSEFFNDLAKVIDAAKQLRWI